jgi:phage/plasmid-associated DNA primase
VRNPQSFDITEEWIAGCVSALDVARREEFRTLRGFPSVDKLNVALPDLGWYAQWNKWVIPIRNINGDCYHVKTWTNNPGLDGDGKRYPRWSTIGMAKARHHQHHGKPIGQLFDLAWIKEHWQQPNWIWVTAGEFDCVMLRCFGWYATCLTIGESSSLGVDFFIREFGGLKMASEFLSLFSGIVLVYDCDDTGVKGMQRHAALLDELFERINEAAGKKDSDVEPLPATFIGVKAIDLRTHPQWEAAGTPHGWDLSDLIVWARGAGDSAAKWLREKLNDSAAGTAAISALLGLEFDEDTGKPTIGDILAPQFKSLTFGELMRAGIDYALMKKSRNEGWHHMAIVAARNGWTLEELWHQETDDVTDELGPMLLKERLRLISRRVWPDKPDMPENEMLSCFDRAFLDYKQQAFIMDDLSNVLRLFHYFRWLRYHPTRGWLWFNRGAWRNASTKVVECVGQLSGLIWEEANRIAANSGDTKLIGKLKAHAIKSRSAGKINAVERLASRHPLALPDPNSEDGGWDNDAWLIGMNDGVFDLRNGVLLDKTASMNAYCSMTCRGTIDARGWNAIVALEDGDGVGERARLWDRVVHQWFDDEDDIRMLQEIGGSCLLGRLIQKIFVFESSGRSGKSLCLSAWSSALGDYAGIILGSVFGSSNDNSKSSAMAGIGTKRMVRMDEMGSTAIDVEMAKTISGEERLAARALRENWVELENCATYVGTSNGPLNLSRDVSEALRNRVEYLRFPHTFVSVDLIGHGDYAGDVSVRVDDGSLTGRLMRDDMADVILTWMYAGLVRMMERASGDEAGVDVAVRIKVTEASIAASEAAWAENNLIKQFFEECGLFRPVGIVEDGGVAHVEAGAVIATNGLRQKMIEWARVADPEFAADLERGPRVLGQMLRKQRILGYEAINNASGALWQSEGRQCRAWRVPYVFIAV